jgi:hypothetical protein
VLFHTATSQMTADREHSSTRLNEALAPTSAGPEAQGSFTDLGGIDHLFRDPFHAALNTASTALATPTASRPGSWGGRVPGYLQHAGVIVKADGEELVQGSLAGIQQIGQAGRANDIVEQAVNAARSIVHRAREIVMRYR